MGLDGGATSRESPDSRLHTVAAKVYERNVEKDGETKDGEDHDDAPLPPELEAELKDGLDDPLADIEPRK